MDNVKITEKSSIQIKDKIRSSNKNDTQKNRYIKWYLLGYNSLQTVGWTFILLQYIYYIIAKPSSNLYDYVQCTLTFFQTVAFLEIAHAYLRLTSSNPFVTLQQIYSRILMVIFILLLVQGSRTTIGFHFAIIAWSITEIIRYSNYALATFDYAPKILIWLRYTTFIFLYPLGVTGELLCMFWAVEEVSRTRQLCLEFPNKWNTIFYYHYFIMGNMSLYIPFFPQLYLHMFTLRKKVLGKLKQKVT